MEEPARGSGAPGKPGDNRRRRRREQSPSTIPALFPRRVASVLRGQTPTQHTEDEATTPTFCISERPLQISTQ